MKQLIALAAFLFLCIGTARSQYLGPKESKVRTENVAWVLDHASFLEEQDAKVFLTGYIIRQVSKEKYLFRDESGSIRIEIDEEDLPSDPFDDKTKVKILGELETQFMDSPEVDVESITIVLD